MPTRHEKYWTESGRGDGQGDVEKEDHQSYRRPYMTGKARGKDKLSGNISSWNNYVPQCASNKDNFPVVY